MTSITHSSAAVTAVGELRDLALKVKGMPIAADDRAQVFALLAETVEAMAATMHGVSADVHEEAPPLSSLAAPDGSLPPLGQLEQELDEAHRWGCRMRDALNEAGTLVEDIAQERRLQDGADQ